MREPENSANPGVAWENGYRESFNGSLRDELLGGEIFGSLAAAKVLIEAWRRHYNGVAPTQQPRLPTAGSGNGSGNGGNNALTINTDHSVGAGHVNLSAVAADLSLAA